MIRLTILAFAALMLLCAVPAIGPGPASACSHSEKYDGA